MCRGWCWDGLARHPSGLASGEPESLRLLSSQLSGEKHSVFVLLYFCICIFAFVYLYLHLQAASQTYPVGCYPNCLEKTNSLKFHILQQADEELLNYFWFCFKSRATFKNPNFEFDLKSWQSCQPLHYGDHLPPHQGFTSGQPDLKVQIWLKVSLKFKLFTSG